MKGLVTYATIAGSTADVAEIIRKRLTDKGHQVEIKKINEVKAIDGFDFIIAGSGVRVGKTYKPFDVFMRKYESSLKTKPTGLFLVCLTMKEDCKENRELAMKSLEKQMIIAPKSVGLFGGVMDFKKIGPIFAAIIRKIDKTGNPEGDFRDIGKINAWADDFAKTLS